MQVYERVAAHAQAGHYMAGSCFWCLTAAGYPDYDGFKVSFGQHSSQEPAGSSPTPQKAELPTPKGSPERASHRETKKQVRLKEALQGVSMPAKAAMSLEVKSSEDVLSTSDTLRHSIEAGPAHSSASSMLRRVSSRTQSNVEAAAAIFDGESAQSELQAAHLGAEAMYLIVQHAAAMHALNKRVAGKDCRVM